MNQVPGGATCGDSSGGVGPSSRPGARAHRLGATHVSSGGLPGGEFRKLGVFIRGPIWGGLHSIMKLGVYWGTLIFESYQVGDLKTLGLDFQDRSSGF